MKTIHIGFDAEHGTALIVNDDLLIQKKGLYAKLSNPKYHQKVVSRYGGDMSDDILGWILFDTKTQLLTALYIISKYYNVPQKALYRTLCINDALYTVFEGNLLDIDTANADNIRKHIIADPPIRDSEYKVHMEHYGGLTVQSLILCARA